MFPDCERLRKNPGRPQEAPIEAAHAFQPTDQQVKKGSQYEHRKQSVPRVMLGTHLFALHKRANSHRLVSAYFSRRQRRSYWSSLVQRDQVLVHAPILDSCCESVIQHLRGRLGSSRVWYGRCFPQAVKRSS